MIYFLKCEQDSVIPKVGTILAGEIKVGTTIRLSVRLKQIAAEIGHTPTVLAIIDGSYAEERAIHDKLRAAWKIGEWFAPCGIVLNLIANEGRPWDGEDEAPLPSLSSAKIDEEVVKKAKIVAAHKDISLAEYLTEALRPIVERDLIDYSRRTLGDQAKRSPKA